MDLTATDITDTSATIGWSIARRRGTQEYVVHYGTDEDSLNTESSSVDSATSGSATDETYEVELTGLTLDTTYYYQVVASDEDFSLESDTASFTTQEIGTDLHITIYLLTCESYLTHITCTYLFLDIAPSGAPENFDASIENTVATFIWDPPAEDEQNGDIVSYFLSCNIGSTVQFQLNLTDSVEEVAVGVYETSSTYTCTISASNSAGEGPTASDSFTTGGKFMIPS